MKHRFLGTVIGVLFFVNALPLMAQTTLQITNAWSAWLSRDTPSGDGDFEDLTSFLKATPGSVCASPVAIEARIRGSSLVLTPAQATREKLRSFSPTIGLVCANADQSNALCSDYEVRFLCAPKTLAQQNFQIEKVEVVRLVKPLAAGNAIALVSVTRASLGDNNKGQFSFDNDNTITVLNDLGESADEKANDLIFSGFVSVDENKIAQANADITAKIENVRRLTGKDLMVNEFSGRNIISKTVFVKSPTTSSVSANAIIAPSVFIKGLEVLPLPKPFPGTPPALVQPANALAINSPSVVANPSFTYDPCNTDLTGNNVNSNAAFSFRTLISNLNNELAAGRPTDQVFVHRWLRNWMVATSANGLPIAARANIKQYFPGWDGINASTLNMNKLPFRLLAIVNRIDLANIAAYGNASPNKPGEIRFVFGLLKMNAAGACIGGGIAGGIDQMTAIFEYRDATNSCPTLKSLANSWITLDANVLNGTAPLGSPAYMAALKTITDTVTAPNVNKLNQLRTNDFAFDGQGSLALPWQLREFVIGNPVLDLVPTTIKQTPDFVKYRGTFAPFANDLADYVASDATNLLCNKHSIPLTFNGQNFLGSNTPYVSNTSWGVSFTTQVLPVSFPSCYLPSYIPGTDAGLSTANLMQIELRHKLSVNTCDDCHAAETDTSFTHISPVDRSMSGFMTGITVNDPTPSPIQRQFDDLARRNQVLVGTASALCGFGGPILLDSFQAKQASLNIIH